MTIGYKFAFGIPLKGEETNIFKILYCLTLTTIVNGPNRQLILIMLIISPDISYTLYPYFSPQCSESRESIEQVSRKYAEVFLLSHSQISHNAQSQKLMNSDSSWLGVVIFKAAARKEIRVNGVEVTDET